MPITSLPQTVIIDSDSFGVASTVNSTVIALTGAATFTGTAEQNSHPGLLVQTKSDVSGTLFFDFSLDGTNWDSTYPVNGYKCAAGVVEVHTAVKGGRFFRIRYVNDSGAQSYLRLTTYFGDYGQLTSALNQTYGLDADATISRSIPHWLDVVRGLTTDLSFVNKFGENQDCAAGDTIDIASTAIDPPATAELCNVVSTHADDDGAPEGAGAFTVLIEGLDENYELASETVILNGTTDVSTVNKYWFVFRMKVVTGSTYAGAVGTITCTSTDSGTAVLATIAIGANQTQSANYQIPAGYTGYFNLPQVTLQNTSNNSVTDLALYNRKFGGVDQLKVDFRLQGGASADYQAKEFGAPLVFNEKDTIYWKVLSVGAGTSVVTVDYDIWLVKEI